MRPISLTVPMDEGWIMNREGPSGRGKAARGKATNERRPGFAPDLTQALKGRDKRLSRTYSADRKVTVYPGLRSPWAPSDLGYRILALWA